MRQAVRAIIIKDSQLLVMNRNKFGEEYDTLPGGNIELGESAEEALVREVNEETMVEFTDQRLVFIEHAGDPYGDQYIFLCNYQSGEPTLSQHSEEYTINQLGKNLYHPQWLALEKLADKPFVSEKLKLAILNGVKEGWPDKPTEIY